MEDVQDPDGGRAGGTPLARRESEPEHGATAPVELSVGTALLDGARRRAQEPRTAWEPPGTESKVLDPAQGPAPHGAGRPARAGRTAREVQDVTPGPHVAQRVTPEPRRAQRGTPVPRVAEQRPLEAVPVHQGNLLDTDKQTKVVEPPGQSETWSPTRGRWWV